MTKFIEVRTKQVRTYPQQNHPLQKLCNRAQGKEQHAKKSQRTMLCNRAQGTAEPKRARVDRDPPLLQLIGRLPVEIVAEHFAGTALASVSRGFRALLREGYLPGGGVWGLDPAAFLDSKASWTSFIALASPIPGGGADAWEAAWQIARRSGDPAALEEYATASHEQVERLCLREFHSGVARHFAAAGDVPSLAKLRKRIACRSTKWKSLEGGVVKAAARHNRLAVIKYVKAPFTAEAAVEAARAGSVAVCLHIRYSIASDTRRDKFENKMVSAMSPETLVAYEKALGRTVPDWMCYPPSVARDGNVDLAIWVVKRGRHAWDGLLWAVITKADSPGARDSSLEDVRRVIRAGCPVTPQDYPHTYREPNQRLLRVLLELGGVRPGARFVVGCLRGGHVASLQMMHEAKGYFPTAKELFQSLETPNLASLKWLAGFRRSFRPEVLVRWSLPRLLATDDAECFSWHYGRGGFAPCPDLASRAAAHGAVKITAFLRDSAGLEPDWQKVVRLFAEGPRETLHPSVDAVDWIFANGSAGSDDLDGTYECMRAMRETWFGPHRELGPGTKERVAAYCRHLDEEIRRGRMSVTALRTVCREVGVKPRGVKGKHPSTYVDCVRAKFLFRHPSSE